MDNGVDAQVLIVDAGAQYGQVSATAGGLVVRASLCKGGLVLQGWLSG